MKTKQHHSTLYKGFIVLVIDKMVRELNNCMAHSIVTAHNTESGNLVSEK